MLQLNEEAALQEVDLLKINHAANEIAQVIGSPMGPELHEMVESNEALHLQLSSILASTLKTQLPSTI